jgi:hypothetical protein
VNIFEKALDARLKLSSGAYIAAGKEYSLIDPLVQISEASVHVHSQLKGAKASLYIDVQKDYVSDVHLYLLLRENLEAEGMKILCRAKGSDFEPVRFEGKIMGIEASLQKSQHIKDGSFFGSVKISFTDAAKILPEALNDIATALKLGKGIKAQGHFFLPLSDDEPFSFRGDLIGESLCQISRSSCGAVDGGNHEGRRRDGKRQIPRGRSARSASGQRDIAQTLSCAHRKRSRDHPSG